MAQPQNYDSGPELAPQSFPEVYHPPQQYQQQQLPPKNGVYPPHPQQPHDVAAVYQQPYPSGPPTPLKQEAVLQPPLPYGSPPPVDPSVYGAHFYGSTIGPGGESVAAGPTKAKKGRLCGCTVLVFVLSVVIAVLAAAVIGLAAGTGVESNRANTAEKQVVALNASIQSMRPSRTVTVSLPAPTTTSFAQLSNNCSLPGSTTDGQTYTTQFFNKVTFTMFCNSETPYAPLLSLFAADFNTCMDACASYTSYAPGFFGATNRNASCLAVSFIPLWTTKEGAVAGGAPGNCYLKPGPQNRTALTKPNIGTEVHAAILTGS